MSHLYAVREPSWRVPCNGSRRFRSEGTRDLVSRGLGRGRLWRPSRWTPWVRARNLEWLENLEPWADTFGNHGSYMAVLSCFIINYLRVSQKTHAMIQFWTCDWCRFHDFFLGVPGQRDVCLFTLAKKHSSELMALFGANESCAVRSCEPRKHKLSSVLLRKSGVPPDSCRRPSWARWLGS